MDLFIFDFDDTLAITDSRVKIILKASNEEILMTSREFAHYPFDPTSMSVDFGDFMRAEGTLIKDTVEIMQQAIMDGADVFIVTARAIAPPVEEFLQNTLDLRLLLLQQLDLLAKALGCITNYSLIITIES